LQISYQFPNQERYDITSFLIAGIIDHAISYSGITIIDGEILMAQNQAKLEPEIVCIPLRHPLRPNILFFANPGLLYENNSLTLGLSSLKINRV